MLGGDRSPGGTGRRGPGCSLCITPMITSSSALGGDFQRGGQALRRDGQRMVARRLEGAVDAAEDRAAGVADLADLAVHQRRRAHDLAAIDLADRLVAEADAEDRDRRARRARSASRQMPASFGVQGPGEMTIASGSIATTSSTRDLVVAADGELRPQLAEEMDEVVGEAVVVIDDEDWSWRFLSDCGIGRIVRREQAGRWPRHSGLLAVSDLVARKLGDHRGR